MGEELGAGGCLIYQCSSSSSTRVWPWHWTAADHYSPSRHAAVRPVNPPLLPDQTSLQLSWHNFTLFWRMYQLRSSIFLRLIVFFAWVKYRLPWLEELKSILPFQHRKGWSCYCKYSEENIECCECHPNCPKSSGLTTFVTFVPNFPPKLFSIFEAFIFLLPLHWSLLSYLTPAFYNFHQKCEFSVSFPGLVLKASPNFKLWINPI